MKELAYTSETQIIEKLIREKQAGVLMSDRYINIAFSGKNVCVKKLMPELEIVVSAAYANHSLSPEMEELVHTMAERINETTQYW